jgi:hypothetical protein
VSLLAALLGLVVAPVVAGLVYVDASRRGRSRRSRLRWALGVGAASFGAVLLPARFGDALVALYLHGLKPAPVVASPLEILMVRLLVGLAFGAAPLAPYWATTRYGSDAG